MRIGVISDTHGHLPNSRAAAQVLQEHEVEAVLHCGDIGSTDVIPVFDRWPTHFVFGNVDRQEKALRDAIEVAGQTCHGRFGSLELSGCRIALLHSDDARLFRETITGGEFALVCYGHTHVAEMHKEGPTRVLNPGALYRASQHTLAIVDLPELAVTSVEVNHV